MTHVIDRPLAPDPVSKPNLQAVAVVDDDQHILGQMVDRLSVFGFEAIPISDVPETVDGAVELIRRIAHFAVCDHKMGGLQGAEIVAGLTAAGVPSLLVSQYKEQEIPDYRHLLDRIPRFITRSEFQKEDIRQLLQGIERDLGRDIPERRPYRALIRVEEILGAGRLVVVIPAWRADEIEMSVRALPPAEQRTIASGTRLFGQVNLRAPSQDELFTIDVHVGHEPSPDDGLA